MLMAEEHAYSKTRLKKKGKLKEDLLEDTGWMEAAVK
jgi:hypothetical protein